MTKSAAVRIVNRLVEKGLSVSLREGYSGRGMYGAETYGIVIDAIWQMREAERLSPALRKSRKDSMGLGGIWY
jgi:hypothetical protein